MARTTIRTEDITASEVTTAKMATDPTNASNLSSGSVPLAQLGNVDTSGLEDDIALLGFKVASNGSLAKYNLVDQTIDDFQDASGVDASASTNEARDSSGKYYYGEATVTPTVSGNYDSTGTDGDYTWYKWTTVTSSGSYTTDTAQDYEYLVVAGGGGGGSHDGGAGGAGGFRTATGFAVAATTIGSITVGGGGAGGNDLYGTSGGDSSFSTITSAGGGGGGGSNDNPDPSPSKRNGRPGGSGGGAGAYVPSGSDVAGSGNVPSTSPAQGYGGGVGFADSGNDYQGGGGGGASAVGAAGVTGDAGDGGAGTSSSITGAAVTYAGGGGGGTQEDAGSVGAGGAGGGGAGGYGANGSDGTANTGGGGGGGGASNNGGAGGSGIVVIRKLTSVTGEGGNMTLVSTTTASQAAPIKGDIVLTYTNGAGTTTLDTDLTAEISADGGSTWTSLPLASEGSTGSHNIATSHDVTISSTITSPWNMAYRIKTLNQAADKTTRIQAVSLGWS